MKTATPLRAGIAVLTLAGMGLATQPAHAAGTCTPKKAIEIFHGQESAGLGKYYADADIWNPTGHIRQRMVVCSHRSWSVDVRVNRHRDRAVTSYPNVHRDYIDWGDGSMPTLRHLKGVSSSFAHHVTRPKRWSYNVAYDVWLNGVADRHSSELMIWTQRHHQRPAGHKRRSVKLEGHRFDFWSTKDGGYLAFVARHPITSGTFNLVPFVRFAHRTGYLRTSAAKTRLGQVDYGIEVVTTNGVRRHADFTRFSVKKGTGMR
ncbi:MAG TPA: hypothetical protein VFJ12_05150 [Segeticoccus sp.]|nr:hypothetical protein [Segeticoccus sp.]